jgi:CorA-like Mg2+ transporter protein
MGLALERVPHPGDQPHDPGQPAELDHEEGDQLAAVIAMPTAVIGFYGMNVPYPGFVQQSGFVASVMLVVVLSGGLYLLFRRLDWL